MKKISLTFIAVIAMMQWSFAQLSTGGGSPPFYYTINPISIGGTALPLGSANLQVTGNVLLGGTNTSPGSGYSTSFLANTKLMLIGWNHSGGAGETDFIANRGAGSLGGFSFYNYDNNNTETALMTLTGNGKVGIGITTPTAPLNVQGGGTTTGIANVASTLTARFNTANPPVTLGIGYVSSDNPFLQAFNSTNSTANNLMLNPFGGNVVIGQPLQHNSAYMLDVYGTARANSIVVNATGADFVFDPSYKLNTLPELKDYITKNHHLPEIASAKEMQKDGLNVGENQVKLLQKVEELTLYLIEKDKQLNEEKKLNSKQEAKIDSQDMINKQLSEQLKSQQAQIDQLKAIFKNNN